MKESCPECGSPLPESAPLGMCPGCLLRSARGHNLAKERRRTIEVDPPASAELEELFAGKFAIAELLGHGGMGAVYRAQQCRIDRPVAIKLLPFRNDDPEYIERFLREAKALGKLSHPNIVTLIDYGEAGGYFYMVMEYVEGGDLGKRLSSGPLPEAETVRVLTQICQALDYAHSSGVIHRDIKPGNILLGEDGTVKLVDFGLAKGINADDRDLNLTWANEMMGTPNYMAPEQGVNPLTADHRADIFSLGVLTYEMLTGTLPSGNFPLPSKTSSVSRRWDPFVLKAMASDPNLRFDRASQMEKKLRSILDNNRNPLLLFSLVASVVLVIGLVMFFKEEPAASPTTQPTGRVVAFGSNLHGQVTKLGSLERDDIIAVAANDEFNPNHCFALALAVTGEVISLGDAPLPPEGLKNVTSIAVGRAHCLALTIDGEVIAWGYDDLPPPQELPRIKQIAAAEQLSAALSTEGEIFVWGNTTLGNKIVFEKDINKDIVEIAAAPNAVFGLKENGEVILRGEKDVPALNYRTPDQPLTTISAGQEFGMALKHNGQLWEWGWSEIGEVPTDDGKGFDQIICGPETSVIRRTNGHWEAWGKISSYFPDSAKSALAIDLGHHVGLAVVPASEAGNYSPPPTPLALEKLSVLGPHDGEVQSLEYDANGALLFIATDKAIYKYDFNDNLPAGEIFRSPPPQKLTTLEWDMLGKRLIVGTNNKKILVFEGDEFPKISHEIETPNSITISSISLDTNTETLFTGDLKGYITTWSGPNFDQTERASLHDSAITDIALAGDRIFTYGWDSRLKVSKLVDGLPQDPGVIRKSSAYGHDLTLTPDGQSLLASDWNGTISRLDLSSMNLSRSWRAHAAGKNPASVWLDAEANARVVVDISPDGKFLASVGGDRAVRIWDLRTDRLVASSPGLLAPPTHVAAFLDHQRVVTSGGLGNSLIIWRIPPFEN